MTVVLLSITASPVLAVQNAESDSASHSTFNSNSVSDFTVGATLPNVVPADGTTSATTTIIVNPFNNFTGTVTLSDFPLPADITCTAIDPSAIPNGSGTATLSCSSNQAGTYAVTITGVSGGISRYTTRTFTFAAFTPPVGIPDFGISAVPSSISIEAGHSGTSRIVLTPNNGFSSAVSLTVAAPAGVTCSLSSTSVQLSGESTLTCNGNMAGDYTVTIAATGGPSRHTTTIDVHVAAASPAAPVPANSPRISLTAFYGIVGTITVIVVAVAVLGMRRSRRSASQLADAQA